MSKDIPRIRMFAGPNGSGKSTLKSIVGPDLLGIYTDSTSIVPLFTHSKLPRLNQKK